MTRVEGPNHCAFIAQIKHSAKKIVEDFSFFSFFSPEVGAMRYDSEFVIFQC